MGSKFYGLKNKGKKRNKTVNESADLPSSVEVNEELIAEQLAAPELTETEVEDLFKSLNEIQEDFRQTHGLPEVEKVVNNAIEKTLERLEVEEKTDFSFVAYGICYSEDNKKFMKIELDYNPKTGYSKLRSVEPFADSAPTALNKLNRILSLKLLKREEKY